MNDFQIFADNYTSSDFDKIKFDWNGEHADKFHDNNYQFRMQLCEFLIPQLEKVKLELIRDLYIELSKCAKEAWSVYGNYHLFAQQLLNRGGTNYIMDYLEGSLQCFDTSLASGRVELTYEQKKNIFDFLTAKLQTEQNEKTTKLLQFGKERFGRAVKV
jgi:hypothetical protein